MGKRAYSDFLAAQPSMLSGASRLLDWYGQFDEYNVSRTEMEADEKAQYSDWAMVGEDLSTAMETFERPHSS